MFKVVTVYDKEVNLMEIYSYCDLARVKEFCAKHTEFFFQVENAKHAGRASIIGLIEDEGDYRGVKKQTKSTKSVCKGKREKLTDNHYGLDNPSWILLHKVDEEKTKRIYPAAGEFVIPEHLRAIEENAVQEHLRIS